MIQGNYIWTQALAQSAKQPLYIVEIPDFAIAIASFTPDQQPATVASSETGYGNGGYGLNTYGT
jgi:hypothetical protein